MGDLAGVGKGEEEGGGKEGGREGEREWRAGAGGGHERTLAETVVRSAFAPSCALPGV